MHLPSDNPDTNHSLVIDCSEGEVFCGLLGPSGQWLSSKQSGPGALEALFPAVASVFHDAGKSLQSVDRFLYCQGPGSVLGLRLGAMAIETWCRLAQKQVERMSYNSLQLTAALLLLDNKELDNALLLVDWKKNTWHSLRINNRTIGQVSPIASERPTRHLGDPVHRGGCMLLSVGLANPFGGVGGRLGSLRRRG